MNKIFITALAILFTLLTACSSITKDIEVEARIDPKVNLSGYKSYSWVAAAEILNDPEMQWHPPHIQIAEEVKFLIDRELRKSGLLMAKPGTADLGVAFFTGIDMEAMQLLNDPSTDVEMLENVPESGLIVAVIDAKTGFVIWVGAAVAEYKADQYTDKEIRQRLDYAISKMFELYFYSKEG